MTLRITDVETITLEVPFLGRVVEHINREIPGWSVVEVCKVTTDAGIVGYGETIINYTWGRVSREQIERVLGGNPFEFLWEDSLGAGLQMAIFDAAGKAAEIPCYRLLGQKVRDRCPISWWGLDMSPQQWVAEAEEAMLLGYTSFKIKARPWRDIFEQVQALCDAVPKDFKLDADFNSFLLNGESAVPVLKELEEFENIAIFETPIPQGDIPGHQEIKSHVSCPIAQHFGSPPPMTALREEICDGFVIGGGAKRVIHQAAIAAEADKPFWLQLVGTGLTTTFALHLGAVCSHAKWPAVTCHELYSDDLLKERIQVHDGHAAVPEAPGLGVEVDEDALEKLRVEKPVEKSEPRRIFCIAWPDGRKAYYARAKQYHQDFLAGNQPVFKRGVTLNTLDEGSDEFAELYEKVQESPVTVGAL